MILFALTLAPLSILSSTSSVRAALDGRSCWMKVKGEALFMGTDACMRRLPRAEVKGYMLIGFEERCFAPTFVDALKLADTPCKVALSAHEGVLPVSQVRSRNLYRVTLQVAANGRKGFYGSGGITDHGYYVVAASKITYLGNVYELATKAKRSKRR